MVNSGGGGVVHCGSRPQQCKSQLNHVLGTVKGVGVRREGGRGLAGI